LVYIDPTGLRTVVFYYDSPGSGFEDQAKASAYFDFYSDDVEAISVTYRDDFIRAWNNLDDSDIDDVYLLLHGGEGVLYFKGESMYLTGENSFDNLDNKNVGGTIYLFSCHGGKGDESKNAAWRFSKLTGAPVRATESSVSYSKIFGSYHARVETGAFFNPFNHFWGNYFYGKKYVFWGDVVPKKSTYLSKWAK
jgi:hypothetical protein